MGFINAKCLFIVILSIHLVAVVEQEIFDFLGFMWTSILLNIVQILAIVLGFFGALQHRRNILIIYIVWCILWIGWNIFVICFYLQVGVLNRDSSVLNMGAGGYSWWSTHGIGCHVNESLSKQTTVDRVDRAAQGCVFPFYYVEVLHAAIQCFLAVLGLSIASFMVSVTKGIYDSTQSVDDMLEYIRMQQSADDVNQQHARRLSFASSVSGDIRISRDRGSSRGQLNRKPSNSNNGFQRRISDEPNDVVYHNLNFIHSPASDVSVNVDRSSANRTAAIQPSSSRQRDDDGGFHSDRDNPRTGSRRSSRRSHRRRSSRSSGRRSSNVPPGTTNVADRVVTNRIEEATRINHIPKVNVNAYKVNNANVGIQDSRHVNAPSNSSPVRARVSNAVVARNTMGDRYQSDSDDEPVILSPEIAIVSDRVLPGERNLNAVKNRNNQTVVGDARQLQPQMPGGGRLPPSYSVRVLPRMEQSHVGGSAGQPSASNMPGRYQPSSSPPHNALRQQNNPASSALPAVSGNAQQYSANVQRPTNIEHSTSKPSVPMAHRYSSSSSQSAVNSQNSPQQNLSVLQPSTARQADVDRYHQRPVVSMNPSPVRHTQISPSSEKVSFSSSSTHPESPLASPTAAAAAQSHTQPYRVAQHVLPNPSLANSFNPSVQPNSYASKNFSPALRAESQPIFAISQAYRAPHTVGPSSGNLLQKTPATVAASDGMRQRPPLNVLDLVRHSTMRASQTSISNRTSPERRQSGNYLPQTGTSVLGREDSSDKSHIAAQTKSNATSNLTVANKSQSNNPSVLTAPNQRLPSSSAVAYEPNSTRQPSLSYNAFQGPFSVSNETPPPAYPGFNQGSAGYNDYDIDYSSNATFI